MSNGSHLAPVEPGHEQDVELTLAVKDPMLNESQDDFDAWEEYPEDIPTMRRRWTAPTLALIAIVGWTGFFGWANQERILAGTAPDQWIEWTVSWSVPVILVLAIWFLAMRNSRVEAGRYVEAASALSHESAQLEIRLNATNRELSIARDFIAAQGRDLEHLGRSAADRLSEHAARIEGLIGENAHNVDRIAEVSVTALDNMERLRADLPVIANSARDVANQIGHAGEGAQGQLDSLISGFRRLNDFGNASERQVDTLNERVGAVLAELQAHSVQLATLADEHFTTLSDRSEVFRTELNCSEIEALATMNRIAEAFSTKLSRIHETIANHEAEAVEATHHRIAALRDNATATSEQLRENEEVALARLAEGTDGLHSRLKEVISEVDRIDHEALKAANMRLAELRTEAEQVDNALIERNRAFEADITARRERMAADADDATGQLTSRLTDLDDALDTRQAAQLARLDTLAAQGESLAARIEELDSRLAVLRSDDDEVSEKLAQSSDELVAKLEKSRAMLESTGGAVAELTDASVRLLELIQAGSEHSQVILPEAMTTAEARLHALREEGDALAEQMTGVAQTSSSVSDYVISARKEAAATSEDLGVLEERLERNVAHGEEARQRISAALEALDEAVQASVSTLREGGEESIANYADKIGERSATAIERAIDAHSGPAIAALDEAAATASDRSREAAMLLRDQLAMVNELTGNLERRVADARERAEEQVDHDFSRRVALISESLNSNAIDLSKALSNEVSDTAWAAYLKGDRGIFTRRAVRLLDTQETRAIADIYEEDADFREHVSRYIHDFEAMLRSLLSTRDGNALSVTMLSSDMGKLYVALAQAIDRLRD